MTWKIAQGIIDRPTNMIIVQFYLIYVNLLTLPFLIISGLPQKVFQPCGARITPPISEGCLDLVDLPARASCAVAVNAASGSTATASVSGAATAQNVSASSGPADLPRHWQGAPSVSLTSRYSYLPL